MQGQDRHPNHRTTEATTKDPQAELMGKDSDQLFYICQTTCGDLGIWGSHQALKHEKVT